MGNTDDLIGKLAREAVAVKPAPHPYLLSFKWMGGAVAYLAFALMLAGVRPDLAAQLQQPWFVAEIAILAAIFVTTFLSAAVLSFPDLHQMRRIAYAPLAAFALLVLVLVFAWRADQPPAPLPVHSFECTLSIMLFALPPAAWLLYAMRKFASTHYHLAGGIALLSAFSVGALWLRLYEVNDSIMHVIQWHYLPMTGCGILGLWLGRIWLKW